MRKRVNFYKGLAADYSKPEPVAPDLAQRLLDDAAMFIAQKEATLPAIGPDYALQQIEAENKAWWPTHCEALRQGRGDLLTGEYRDGEFKSSMQRRRPVYQPGWHTRGSCAGAC